MSIFKTILNTLTGGSFVKDVMAGADKLFTSKEEKAQIERLLLEAENKHKEQIISLTLQAQEQYFKDRQSAREMQKEALRQNDQFSKRFVYYLAILILLAAIGFGASLLWIEFPESNRRMIEMFADIFLFSGAMIVIQFFFGSSRGSDEKNALFRSSEKPVKNE